MLQTDDRIVCKRSGRWDEQELKLGVRSDGSSFSRSVRQSENSIERSGEFDTKST